MSENGRMDDVDDDDSDAVTIVSRCDSCEVAPPRPPSSRESCSVSAGAAMSAILTQVGAGVSVHTDSAVVSWLRHFSPCLYLCLCVSVFRDWVGVVLRVSQRRRMAVSVTVTGTGTGIVRVESRK